MPAMPNVPNVVKVVVECQGNDGRYADNVMHFTYGGGPPSSSDCVAIANSFFNSWTNTLTLLQVAHVSLVEVTVTDLSTSTGGEGSFNNGGNPFPGTRDGHQLALNTCFLLSKFVEQRYRGGHPRSYLSLGVSEDLTDDGDWSTDFVTSVGVYWPEFLQNVLGANPYGSTSIGQECAVSYISKEENPVYPYRRTTPLVYDIPLDGYTYQPKIATQRRRVRKTERRV